MSNSLTVRIRNTILDIRRRPYPISDLIPMLAEAADYIENLEKTLKWESDLAEQALSTIKNVADANCKDRLRDEGKPYPRTCSICKLGKCEFK